MAAETAEKTVTNRTPPDGAVPSYRLVHKTGGAQRFPAMPLAPGVTYVGRMSGNDVVLDSELVSRRHAKIILTDMGVTVHDLDSHNGIFLNGKKVRSTPLAPGDLVYFGDVCCALEEDEGAPDTTGTLYDADINRSSLVHDAASLRETDDPAVRSLATLIQATDLLLGAADDAFFGEVLELCRALVSANLAVLITKRDDGLESSVVLREAAEAGGEPPVRWPLVQKAVEDRVVFFSHEDGSALFAHDAAERAAILCVPIVVGGEASGALYFSRPVGSRGFTERDVETLSAVAHIVGARMSGRAQERPGAASPPEDMDTSIHSIDVSLTDTSEEATRAELDRLQSEVESLTRQRDEREAERTSLVEKAQALEAELAAAREAVAHLENAHAEREAEERARAAAEDARDGERQAALDALGDELAQARAEGEELRARAEEREGALEKVQAELEAARRESEEELARSREALEELQQQLAATKEEAAAALQQVGAHELQLVAAKKEIERLEGELERLGEASAADKARSDALHAALVEALPEPVSMRVLALADGDTDSPLLVGDRTVLAIGLAGFDAWAASAAPTEVQARLDYFCSRVRRIIGEHGGIVEQVLGHTQLALFDAHPEGVLAAARCARALADKLRAESGVQIGLHTGSLVLGFFGEGSGAVRVAVGESVAVARAAQEVSQPGAVMVSESVRSKIPEDSGMMLVNCGPHIIRGMPQPMTLFQLTMVSS